MRRLLAIMGRRRRSRVVILALIMVAGSFFEMLGIGSAVAACTALADLPNFMSHPLVRAVWEFLGSPREDTFVVIIISLVIGIYIARAAYLVLETYYQSRFVRNCRHDVTVRIMGRVLSRPYLYFINANSASIMRSIIQDTNNFATYLEAFLKVITEGFVVACMAALLLVVSPFITLVSVGCLLAVLLIVRSRLRRRLLKAGELRREMESARVKWVNQSVHGIKDIKVGRSERFFYDRFAQSDALFTQAEIANRFWSSAPSYVIESIVVIGALVYLLIQTLSGVSLAETIPVLVAFALVLVRLVPATNRINSNLTSMSYHVNALRSVEESLAAPLDREALGSGKDAGDDLALEHSLVGDHLTFSYRSDLPPVLRDASIEVPIGSAVGIVGASGAGKTTLVDILLGLLSPQSGQILADGVSVEEHYSAYLRKVAYIPQTIFVLDDTIRANVAMGVDEESVDDELVWRCLEDAALAKKVRSLPEGLDTLTGDRGVRLSGGERQRLAIARALYWGCEVVFLDEATSALDVETESAILRTVHAIADCTTFIIVAHDPRTIADCDLVYEIADGKVRKVRG